MVVKIVTEIYTTLFDGDENYDDDAVNVDDDDDVGKEVWIGAAPKPYLHLLLQIVFSDEHIVTLVAGCGHCVGKEVWTNDLKPAASLHCIAFSCKCIAHKNYIGLRSNEILHI